MASRRFTRLTNGFSKRLESHRAAVNLWVCFYNLCRYHETLRCTPAMALGVTDHIWTVGELVQAALEPSDVPPLPRPTQPTTLRPGYRPFRPVVIRGGKLSKQATHLKSGIGEYNERLWTIPIHEEEAPQRTKNPYIAHMAQRAT